jgi:hypothetical protein
MITPICSRRRNNVDILGQDGGRGSAPNGQGKRLKCCSNEGAELHLRVVVGDAMVGAKNQALLPGRVPHVRPTSPGVPWGVHGRNKTGRSPFQRSCYVGNETTAKIKNPCTWSESIGRIRFRPMYAPRLPVDCIWVLIRSVTVMFTSDCSPRLFRSATRLYHSRDP